MNQELMTLDFWQDTVIYEGKIFPIGTLACDALNVPADTLARMNEQCEKINLLLGMLNAGQDASALFPIIKWCGQWLGCTITPRMRSASFPKSITVTLPLRKNI